MSRAVWLALGIGVGFAAAHKANETPRGRAFFEKVGARLTDFTDAVVDGYQGRDFELRGVHSDPTAAAPPSGSPTDPGRAGVRHADTGPVDAASSDAASEGHLRR